MKKESFVIAVALIVFVIGLGLTFAVSAQPSSDDPAATEAVTAEPTEMVTAEPTEMVTAEPTEMVTSEPGGINVTIIIEGPVQAINVNIITIYDMDVEIDDHDPILTHIHVGDFVRVEGNVVGGTTVIVIPVVVYVVNINVIFTNNAVVVWSDDGTSCGNPPPPWAPANGWRRRCQSHPTIIISGGSSGNSSGGKGGMGMGGDD